MHQTANKGIAGEIEAHNTAFSLAFLSIFTVLFVSLSLIGVVPDPADRWQSEHGGAPVVTAIGAASNASTTQTVVAEEGQQPVKIVIDAIDLTADINNPDTIDNATLDTYLLKGAVHYPTSANLGIDGTVLLFGHSSYLPILNDGAYKTFDGIQNLETGDEISVYSATEEYRYTVTSVGKADASTDSIPLRDDGAYLTLVTCDDFISTKEERFIVTAQFTGAYSLANS